MPLDPYVSCPCGSGKKFKWCCASYFSQVEKAFELERLGQHESALTTLHELARTHAGQPAVWCYLAQFLYAAQQPEKAEEAIESALKLNPKFGMAFFLRGMFRQQEGELVGALMLFRRAAEVHDVEAGDQLIQIYESIYQLETLFGRPVAARAALEKVVALTENDPNAVQLFQAFFGDKARSPLCSRKEYAFRPTAKRVPIEATTGKLTAARAAYEHIVAITPTDPAAWFNLGVACAKLGDNVKAVEALNKSVELEPDDHRAEEAAALAEVLRCGMGLEAEADYHQYTFVAGIRDGEAVMALLQALDAEGRLLSIRANQETGDLSGMIVDPIPSLLAVGSVTMARVVARMTIRQGLFRLWHPKRETLGRIVSEIRTRAGLALEEGHQTTVPPNLLDILFDAILYPTQSGPIEVIEEKLRAHSSNYFEEVWLSQPRKSLGGATPFEAVHTPVLRRRLFGAIRFIEDCFTGMLPQPQEGGQPVPLQMYDFNNLRSRLGLTYMSAPPPVIEVPAEPEPPPPPPPPVPVVEASVSQALAPAERLEIAAMGLAELRQLDISAATAEELEQAMRAALKNDARELALHFAAAGVAKPAEAARPDRYPLYACLITGAVADGDLARAVGWVEDGVQYDEFHNAGKRANDYGMRKAQLFVKFKDSARAGAEFDELIARNPDESRFYTTAAEEMLRLKDRDRAARFIDHGLARARQLRNGDFEGHCLELKAAVAKLT